MSDRRHVHIDDEERVAAVMSRELEALAALSAIQPPVGFTDRVMAAVAAEPRPQPVRAFGVALVGGHLGAALASVGDAWRVVVGGSTTLGVRAQALALVLVVTIGSLAVAGGATVGAIGLLTADPLPTPAQTTPLPTPTPSPTPTPTPSPSPEPTGMQGTNETPEASPDANETPDTSKSPDAGETPGTSKSPEPTGTREPSNTREPSRTPEPTETPSPSSTGTDDHGGDG